MAHGGHDDVGFDHERRRGPRTRRAGDAVEVERRRLERGIALHGTGSKGDRTVLGVDDVLWVPDVGGPDVGRGLARILRGEPGGDEQQRRLQLVQLTVPVDALQREVELSWSHGGPEKVLTLHSAGSARLRRIPEVGRYRRLDRDLAERHPPVVIGPDGLSELDELSLEEIGVRSGGVRDLPLGHLVEGAAMARRKEAAGRDETDVLIPPHRRFVIPGLTNLEVESGVRLGIGPAPTQIQEGAERRKIEPFDGHRHRRGDGGIRGLPHEDHALARRHRHPERGVAVRDVHGGIDALPDARPYGADGPLWVARLRDCHRPIVRIHLTHAEAGVPELHTRRVPRRGGRIDSVHEPTLGTGRDDETEGSFDGGLVPARSTGPLPRQRHARRPGDDVAEAAGDRPCRAYGGGAAAALAGRDRPVRKVHRRLCGEQDARGAERGPLLQHLAHAPNRRRCLRRAGDGEQSVGMAHQLETARERGDVREGAAVRRRIEWDRVRCGQGSHAQRQP